VQLARALTIRHAEPHLLWNPILRTANHDKERPSENSNDLPVSGFCVWIHSLTQSCHCCLFSFQRVRSHLVGLRLLFQPSLQASSISLSYTVRPASSSSSVLSSRLYCGQRALSDRRSTVDISRAQAPPVRYFGVRADGRLVKTVRKHMRCYWDQMGFRAGIHTRFSVLFV
jgi:hypothetical protein